MAGSGRLARTALLALVIVAVLALGRSGSGSTTAPAVVWTDVIEVASGAAVRGPWRMNESVFDFVDDPTVAVDARGRVSVVWADLARKDLLFQRYGPEGDAELATPVNVSRSPRIFSWLPRVAVPADDPASVYVLWQEIVFSGGSHGGEIFFARSGDGGRTFGEPVNLSNSAAGDGKGRLTADVWHNGSLDLVLGPVGDVHVAWTEYEGRLWYRRSTDGGTRFGEPLLVAGGAGAKPARGPALAVDDRGTVHLAWTVGEDAGADIRVASSRDGGRSFGAARVVGPAPGRADAPALAVDRTRTVHLVYAEYPAGRGGRPHVRHTRRADGAETFAAPRTISVAPGGVPAGAGFPTLAADGADRLYVIWERFVDDPHRPRGLGFAASADGGATFSPVTTVPGTEVARSFNGSQQGLLMRKLAVNAAGAIAVVNSVFRAGEASHVRLVRGRGADRDLTR